jgi:hypothetical protein
VVFPEEMLSCKKEQDMIVISGFRRGENFSFLGRYAAQIGS